MSHTEVFAALETINNCLEKRDELLNSGDILTLKQQITSASVEDKKLLGPKLNLLKQSVVDACNAQIKTLQEALEKDDFTSFDPTFFSFKYKSNKGSLHPISQVSAEILEIFENMGFDVESGPLVTTQENCFTLLNIPDYHPARGMQDTFFLKEKDENGENYVMRTHTTAEDIPYAKSKTPPFKVVFAGQVYRNENIDATHDIMFHQIECLVVAKRASVAHLKTLIEQFYSQFFGQSDLKVRLRPSYFSYTIPSMEVDISNPFKNKPGVSSKLASQDWIEAGGAGLLHPQVIKNMGLDPNQWQGLAFGFGIDRMAQLKLGVSGLGQFFNGHLDFLKGR